MAKSVEINGNLMSKSLFLKNFKSFLALSLSALLFVQFVSPQTVVAQEKSPRAYAIKAGFIYNFTRFIKWPPPSKFNGDNKSYNICVIGDNPFGSILDRLEAKHRNKQHPLKIELDVSQGNFRSCHILFVSFSERFKIEQYRKTDKRYSGFNGWRYRGVRRDEA